MVEGARLESVYTVTPYRGFESLLLRHYPFSGSFMPFHLYKIIPNNRALPFSGLLSISFDCTLCEGVNEGVAGESNRPKN